MSDLRTEDPTTTGVPVQRPVTVALGGAFIVLCAVIAASAAAAPDAMVTAKGYGRAWHYPPVMWPSLLTLAAAGLVIVTRPRWTRPAALLTAIVAAQMAGHGLMAVRAWFTVQNGGIGQLSVTPITYAAAVMWAASAAAVAAAALVWREPAAGWRSLLPAQPVYVAAGVAVVILLPRMWNAAAESGDITGLQHIATLTYALPWGAGLAALGWIRGRTAVAAGVTVTVAGLLCAMYLLAIDMLTAYLAPLDSD